MDTLGNYTTKWSMEINPSKTKIMIFNDPMKRKENEIFHSVNNQIIRITKSYKYLGIILNNKHSYKAHVDIIVDKANKCLFTFITKNEEWKGFKPTLLLYLFDHLTSPKRIYGCEIWGKSQPRGWTWQTYRQGSAELGISERPQKNTLPLTEDPKSTLPLTENPQKILFEKQNLKNALKNTIHFAKVKHDMIIMKHLVNNTGPKKYCWKYETL